MRSALFAVALMMPLPATAMVSCGGDFATFVQNMENEAVRQGYAPATTRAFFSGVERDPDVIRRDRAQGFFQRPFTDFSRRLISQNRLDNGRLNADRWDSTFDNVEQSYGVDRGVLLALWAFETDFGAFQGDFNTVNALVTLGHDCRRPELFQPQVFSALELFARGDLDPATTSGAWAGEIGMVQMLPGDILENGVDADGDGQVNLKTSPADALTSGGKMLQSFGWESGQPWLQEVIMPSSFDWGSTGLDTKKTVREWRSLGVRPAHGNFASGQLDSSILIPQGKDGPAFIAYPNFDVYFEWNQSFVYVLTAAYFATRLEGAPVYDARNPAPGLNGEQIEQLQNKLIQRGYDVGGADGILGRKTRAAIQAEQKRLGLPADAWPSLELLNRL